MAANSTEANSPTLDLRREPGNRLLLELRGDWSLAHSLPDFEQVKQAMTEKVPTVLAFEGAAIGKWDSGLIVFLQKCADLCQTLQITLDDAALPEGARGLLRLSTAVPEKKDTGKSKAGRSIFYRIGEASSQLYVGCVEALSFIGEVVMALLAFVTGRARFRWSDFWVVVQQTGIEALPIVALINFLVGLILAFVAAVQLQQFGASIYVADLVGLAMVREMGAMMTAVIMCGRTGAAFAAQLGTMKVNEEIGALETMGISPMEFLVLPRMLALFLMMPLLVFFGNYIGIFGGLVVSLVMLDVTMNQYINQVILAVDLTNFMTGITKSVFFGGIVAGAGCLRGMQSGDSSAAVGLAATSAVVTGITLLILCDALFAVLFNLLGI